MFLKAIPVYAQGKAREKNTHIVLRAARTNLRQSALRIAAASFYRVWVNGRFVGFGPARAAGGYARVDRIDLSPYADGDDELIVEAPEEEAERVEALLRECMEGVMQLSVPLKTDISIGGDWRACK